MPAEPANKGLQSPAAYLVSASPHIRSEESVARIMWVVAAALAPAGLMGFYVFGWCAMVIVLLSVFSAVVSEALAQLLRRRPVTVSDGSAVVTGVLLGYVLPPDVAWYVPVVGGVVAIGLAKQAFGGLGYNIFNPALVGRAFLHFGFPAQLNKPAWPLVVRHFWGNIHVDAVSSATPLALLKMHPGQPLSSVTGHDYSAWKAFAGAIPGCIGETSALLILLGGLLLILYRYVDWRLPLAYIGTLLAAVLLLPVPTGQGLAGGLPALLAGEYAWENLAMHAFSGGLFLGGFFMLTDMVTSPLLPAGQVIYGMLGGLLAALIRLYAGYPEGVCFSILLANAARPLIDRLTMRRRVFGARQ